MRSTHSIIGRWIAAGLAMLAMLAAIYNVVVDNMPKGEVRVIEGYAPWSEKTIKEAQTLPLQDGGRIKPLLTYAGFKMLSLHGARSMKIDNGDGEVIKLKPTEWMLDTLFRPEIAIKQPTFRVDNSAALEAIGVKPRGRRDRYSYEEIEVGREKLVELSQSYRSIDSKKRDPVQNQIVALADNFQQYEILLGYFTFARSGIVLSGVSGQPNQRTSVSAFMATAPELQQYIRESEASGQAINPQFRALLQQVLDVSNFSKYGLFLLPPDKSDEKWRSGGETIMSAMTGSSADLQLAVSDIVLLENLGRSVSSGKFDKDFRKAMVALKKETNNRAEDLGESKFLKLEASYYRMDFFLNAMVLFLLGTLTAMAMWTFGRSLVGNVLSWGTLALTAIGLGYCLVAIVIRCIIMQRPPVGNLYDTIIFIAAAMVGLTLIVELLTRYRFALGISPMVGAALIILARRYELGDAKDHMDPLVAVLDSNYWLTTHVITITLGYAAGLLTAFLSGAYVLIRGLNLDDGNKSFRRIITRCSYGMVCVTLFLSLVGTVLGGIWANDSWGRFWGWDPKENGALLIVLWTLVILHARLGGYLREWGLHLAAIFTAIIVTFSWWHVNFLGVGLHNYGFTAGKGSIWMFYIVNLALLFFGTGAMIFEKFILPGISAKNQSVDGVVANEPK